MRRQFAADDTGHTAQRARHEELDHLLIAAPATGWVEAVAKARYLLILLAQSPAAEDLRRARLIADVFADFERLLAEPKNPPVAGVAGLAQVSHIQKEDCDGKRSATREPRSQEAEKGKAQDRGGRPGAVRAQSPKIDGGEGRSRQEEIARRNAIWRTRDQRETVRVG